MSSRKDGENRKIGTPPGAGQERVEDRVYIGMATGAGKDLGASLPVMHTGRAADDPLSQFVRKKASIPKTLRILENANK